MTPMHAVITGATGMIGSALVRACLAEGMQVTALVRTASQRMGNLPESDRLRVIDCDVRSLSGITKAQVGQADFFFHLAWIGSAPSGRGLLHAQVDNVQYTVDAVELAGRLGCTAFVGTGSQAEYGRVEGDLTAETPTRPETGYGVAKLAAGQMSRLACEQLDIRHEWARILSIYGPGDAAHTMVMSVIADACAGRSPQCTKGEQLWDYLYCDDCAQALLAMALHGADGAVYPVGSGRQRRLSAFIKEICAVAHPQVTPDLGARPYMDKQVMNLRADITALTEDTGFIPQVSFEDGIARTIEWYRSKHVA